MSPIFISHFTLTDLESLSNTNTNPPSSESPSNAPSSSSPSDNSKSSTIINATSIARSRGYEAICIPLTNEKWKSRWKDMCLLPGEDDTLPNDREEFEKKAEMWRLRPGYLKDEVTITRLDEAEGVIGLASEWLELDAADDWVRNDAETALLQELSYAYYLGIQTAILPAPRNRSQVGSYARAINACLATIPYVSISVKIPIYDPSMIQLVHEPPLTTSVNIHNGNTGNRTGGAGGGTFIGDQYSIATWEMWDAIRSICDYNTRLTLTLDMTLPLPSETDVLRQWVAEPVRFLFLPASIFIPNVKGYPVLPKGTQSFLRDIMKIQPYVILSGAASGRHNRGGEAAYIQYIRHLEKTSPAVKASHTAGTVENFALGYLDYLQAPLQPLMDNLQSMTYQTFEQDPVKYRNYEEAVYRALREWPRPGRISICVAGAGRGPLVARCMKAMIRAGKTGPIYAVEKNPNAYVTLQERSKNEWGDKVQLLFGDMRTLNVPEKVDILVSELLGSFGDNELSPECLDGAMRFLKGDGISIPASYTAHLAPLSSSKLYNESRSSTNTEKGLETPYVVMFSAINILSDDGPGLSGKCGPQVQECWEFEHPRRDAVLNDQGLPLTNSHNARFAKLSFHIPHAGILHGLAGYFEAVLYGNIGLSIHPQRMPTVSKDMLSWFPIFFPFREPLYLPSNSELQVSIWRLTNERQVWYEWFAEAFLPLPSISSPSRRRSMKTDNNSNSHYLGASSLNSSSSGAGSPMVDAEDISLPTFEDAQNELEGEPRIGLVKIGQTFLHNPKGRSSWIGL